MTCEEASFLNAVCRITIHEDSTWGPDRPRFVANLFVVESDRVRPVWLDEGYRVGLTADNAGLLLNSAVTYLEGEFGAFSQMTRACGDRKPEGSPYVVSKRAVAG